MGKKKKQSQDVQPGIDPLNQEIDQGLEEAENPPPSGASKRHQPPPQQTPDLALTPQVLSSPEENQEPKPTEPPVHPTLSLNLSDNGLKAILRAVPPEITLEGIHAFLEKNGVSFGLCEQRLQEAINIARETGTPVRDVVAAKGKPARKPAPPYFQYQSADPDVCPSLDLIARLLVLPDPAELEAAAKEQTGWLVHPGDLLATLTVGAEEPGMDVRGQPIPPEPIQTPGTEILPGPGVRIASNGTLFTAALWGYAGLQNDQLSVLAPIWVPLDGLAAFFLNLSPPASTSLPPSPDEIRATLAAAGIISGIREEAIQDVCSKWERLSILAPLAYGRPPIPPQDGTPGFSFEFQLQAGAIQSDGSIDFKERNLFPPVKKDALLARSIPPVPGKPGQTVRGEEIPTTVPIGIALEAGENVRLQESNGAQQLYADIDGGASVQIFEIATPDGPVKRYNVAVHPVAQIAGDVNYHTGNINFLGNVEIRGSVTSGFHVSATGDISISGSVENAVRLQAGGNITIRQGILGQDTHVKAAGAVAAKFIHHARVQTGGDVVVGSYIHNAHIHSKGSVVVEGRGGSGGGIVGGETWAHKSITSRNAGSERNTSTFLAAGTDLDLHTRYDKVEQCTLQVDAFLRNLLNAIGLKTLTADEVRRAVLLNPSRKHAIVHYVKKANQLMQQRKKYAQEKQVLGAQMRTSAAEANLSVPGTIHAQVRIRIGQNETRTQNSFKNTVFRTNPDKGIIQTSLSDTPKKS
ncbi:MAG: FapA family protein [bacterium]|nr:FapA family protein [bacterium]